MSNNGIPPDINQEMKPSECNKRLGLMNAFETIEHTKMDDQDIRIFLELFHKKILELLND